MRNVILSLVVVTVLVAGGLGGTLAGFSDSEVSQDNFVTTGSLDLKVNGADDLPWGTGVLPKVTIEHLTPCKVVHVQIDVRNDGQCEIVPILYIHFKNFVCENMPPVHDGYPAPDGSGMKPEPELVAEYGGLVDQRWVPGIGQTGDDCSMASHISCAVSFGPAAGPMVEIVPATKLWLLSSKQIELGPLPPCGEPYVISLALHLQQIGPDDTPYPTKDDPDVLLPLDPKFQYWQTNALMKDKVTFDIEFDLIQLDPPGGG